MVKDGKLWLNGQPLDEPYLPPEYVTRGGQYMREGQEIVVQPETIMAIGDNRGHSSDSREWGTGPFANLIGKAVFRYWSPNAFWGVDRISVGPSQTSSAVRESLAVILNPKP